MNKTLIPEKIRLENLYSLDFLLFLRCLLTHRISREEYKALHQLLDQWTKIVKRKRYCFKIKLDLKLYYF